MKELKKFTANQQTKILVPAHNYDLNEDKRLLIPFTRCEKIGFMNREGDVVLEPQFDMYYGECYNSDDLIKVSKIESYGFPKQGGKVSCYQRPLYGIINSKGEFVFDVMYLSVLPAIGNKTLFTIENKEYQYGVMTVDAVEIIPFGKYSWIDGFDNGFARVKNGRLSNGYKDNDNLWGLIDVKGEEVLPLEYTKVWSFYGKNRKSTRVEKNGFSKDVFFRSLKIEEKEEEMNFGCYEDDYYGHTFGEYAGSYAQDVMGFSDDIIDDAFEGDPDAYWNID